MGDEPVQRHPATQQTVGGKNVLAQVAPGAGGTYLYVKDDVIYFVASFGTTSLAEGILKQLP